MASALAATRRGPSDASVSRQTPRRSASCRSTLVTASPTSRASQLAPLPPDRTAGRLKRSSWFNFVDSRSISSTTSRVSPLSVSGNAALSSCNCRIVFIEPSGFFKLCEMLAAIWPSAANRSRSASSRSSCSFSSIRRHRSRVAGNCSHKNSSAAAVSPDNIAPCGFTRKTPSMRPACSMGNALWKAGFSAGGC